MKSAMEIMLGHVKGELYQVEETLSVHLVRKGLLRLQQFCCARSVTANAVRCNWVEIFPFLLQHTKLAAGHSRIALVWTSLEQ